MRQLVIVCAALGMVAAIVGGFLATRQPSLEPPALTQAEGSLLLRLVREDLTSVLAGQGEIAVEEAAVPPRLRRSEACFVTLAREGVLRGCMIDRFEPHEPLYQNAIHNAVLAATGDERFPQVSKEELDKIRIEISVLGRVRRLVYRDPEDLVRRLTPGEDGVILTTPVGTSTYLPQVWRDYPDPAEFLSHLCEKQGASAGCWQAEPRPRVEIYRVLRFAEGETAP